MESTIKRVLIRVLFASLCLAVLLVLTPGQASAQDVGNYCVADYLSPASCTANDVRIEQLRIVNLIKPCNVEPKGVLVADFELLISAAGSPNRYDVGVFLATDGGSALTGDSCYHGFLPPPITTTPVYGDKNNDGFPDIDNGNWWNGESPKADTCGDIAAGTQVFRTVQQLQISCTDIDQNGAADISVCSSWDNNTNSSCNSVLQAIPGTGSKCSCSVVNFDFTPTAVENLSVSAKSKLDLTTIALSGFGVLVLGLVLTSLVWRRRQSS